MKFVRRTFKLYGMNFRMKPTSENNMKALQEHINDANLEMLAMTPAEQWIEVMKMICDPADDDAAFDKIDPQDFDIMEAQEALANFMPTLMQTFLVLDGFSRS